MTRSLRHATVAAALLIACSAAWAGVSDPLERESLVWPHDSVAYTMRGYPPKYRAAWYAGGGDVVDTYNLHFTTGANEQIAFTLPVDGGVQVDLRRIYNSNPYPQIATSRGDVVLWVPRQYPMGLGWEFSLGRIVAKPDATGVVSESSQWVFIGPDGAAHDLYLVEEDADCSLEPVPVTDTK